MLSLIIIGLLSPLIAALVYPNNCLERAILVGYRNNYIFCYDILVEKTLLKTLMSNAIIYAMTSNVDAPSEVTLAAIGRGEDKKQITEKLIKSGIGQELLTTLDSVLRFLPIPCKGEQDIDDVEMEIDKALARYPEQTGLILLVDQDLTRVVFERFEKKRKTRFRVAPKDSIPYFLIPSETLILNPAQRPPTAIEDKEIEIVANDLKGTIGPVLLIGETGTGKTRIARRLHEGLFDRSGKEFREVNCASLDPTESRMSTFFRGVEDGVYTNVKRANPVFKDIEGGTLFLDEFQELKVHQQAMLLDLLDSFTTRVSGYYEGKNKEPWDADVQVIVAINESLEILFRDGKLRKDIYHRLWRRVNLPPLRERLLEGGRDGAERELRHKILRMQEIGIRLTPSGKVPDSRASLLENVRKAFTLIFEEGKLRPGRVSLQEMPVPEELILHSWPGNFRELEALAHMLMAEGIIGNWAGRINEKFRILVGGTFDTKETPTRQPFDENPSHLMGRAWEAALTRPHSSLPQVARALGLDPRSIKKRLEYLCDPSNEAPCKTWFSFLEVLSEEQKEKLVVAAKAFLSKTSNNRPV